MRKITLPDGGSVNLHSWSTNLTPRLRNVVGLTRDGTIRWRAELPTGGRHDCFVRLRESEGSVIATTYTGVDVRLCPLTGVHLAITPAA